MSSDYEVVDRRLAFKAGDVKAMKIADELLALVQELTPVGTTGELRDGWRLVWDAPQFFVENPVRYARMVEFGSSHVPPAGMMGRASAMTKARYGLP
jgi:hypothetical protein